MVDFLKRLFGGGRKPNVVAPGAPREPAPVDARPALPSDPPPVEVDPNLEAAFVATCEARQRFWESVGAVEPDFIAYLMSPGLRGGPFWPTLRQAFRVIRRPTTLVVATDGLADPFEDVVPCGSGFELELFVETSHLSPDVMASQGVDALKTTWAFALVENVARLIADSGGIRGDLDDLGVVSAELPGMIDHPAIAQQVPARFITEDGSIGVLIGVPAATIPGLIEDAPNTTLRIASIVLLTAAELNLVATDRAAGRQRVLDHLMSTTGHVCDLERASAI